MNKRDQKRFKTMRWVITFLTLSGIDVLFFMTIEPWNGGAWIAQLGMLGFVNVAVGFALYWLMDYAHSPDIPQKVNQKSVYVHAFRSQAYNLAANEIGVSSKYDLITHTHYDSATDSIMLWVSHKRTNAESNIYYYNKEDKSAR